MNPWVFANALEFECIKPGCGWTLSPEIHEDLLGPKL